MYQPNVSVMPVTGAGSMAMAYTMSGTLSVVLYVIAVWTLVMAARTIYRMTPFPCGDVR